MCQAESKSQMQPFSELPISSYIQERLAAARFTIPTPVQAATIPQALQGKDVLATAQTGTGKTLAFLVPVIEHLLKNREAGVSALVLVPTRELGMQIVEVFNALRGQKLAAAALVIGGLSEEQQLRALRSGARLVVATPGRLEDFLDRQLVNLRAVRILILDEADRMLDMGFLPAMRRIIQGLPRERQTMCFSATLEASVAQMVHDSMKSPVRLAFGSTLKPAENVRVQAFEVAAGAKHQLLHRLLARETGRCLVFARTKRGTERLAKRLKQDGFSVAMIHGDRSQSQRTAALSGFQQGRFRVLVATDVASRGIHVQDIAHVINYDLPKIAEDFIHRVGRTGRAGEQGLASTLVQGDELMELRDIERTLGIRMDWKHAEAVRPGEQERKRRETGDSEAMPLASGRRMARLPGEILQKHGDLV